MLTQIPLLFLARKARQTTPRAFGPLLTPADHAREKLRAVVRSLLGSWILLSLALMLLLDWTAGGREDVNAVAGLLLAAVLVLPLWCAYRIVRFAIGY